MSYNSNSLSGLSQVSGFSTRVSSAERNPSREASHEALMEVDASNEVITPNYLPHLEQILSGRNLLRLPEEAKEKLMNFLNLSVDFKMIMNPLDPRKRELSALKRSEVANFITCCQQNQINLEIDSDEEPLVIVDIGEKVQQIVANVVTEQKKSLIQSHRRAVIVEQLNIGEIDRLFAECSLEKNLIDRVNIKLSQLIELAKLPENIASQYSLTIRHKGYSEVPFEIVVEHDNLLLGYSIYDLLHSIELLSSEEYQGAMSFSLTKENLEKLDTHLSEVVTWGDDFRNIVGDLLGNYSEAQNYVSLGQKLVTEIWSNPIHLSNEVMNGLYDYPRDYSCLLFNHLSLNLIEHPHRDFIKEKFLELYRAEGLLGANRRPKEFYRSEPYRSTIGIAQLIKICPRLNKLIKFQQLAQFFTEEDNFEDAVRGLRNYFQNDLEVMCQYKVGIVNETVRAFLGGRAPRNLFQRIDNALAHPSISTIDILENKSLQVCESLLQQYTGPLFTRRRQESSITQAQINALYEGEKFTVYDGRQRHKNVSKLFDKLRASPAYVDALREAPGVGDGIESLEAELIRRLNVYHRLPRNDQFFGQNMVDQSISFFEHYVGKIVYRAQANVTQESIKQSLIILAGTVGEDLSGGCASGLAGRINTVLLSLSFSTGSDLKDRMIQFQKDCLEGAFQQIQGFNSESSMHVVSKERALEFIGTNGRLSPGGFESLPGTTQTLLRGFFNEYTPTTIYHMARTFFADKFWEYNKENEDEKIYQLFKDLEFEGSDNKESIDKQYRVNGDPANRWQYAFFQQDLPRYLFPFLIKQRILFVKDEASSTISYQREGEGISQLSREDVSRRSALSQRRMEVDRTSGDESSQNVNQRIGYVGRSNLPDFQPSTS